MCTLIAEGLLAASLLAGANYADLHTTRQALANCPYCVEVNPLIGRNGERLIPMKILATGAQTAVFVAIRKKHKKTAWAFVAAMVGANLALAHHNRRVMR